MPAALLETKFYVPQLRRGVVPRRRLSERLDRGVASKLMLVSAPAGFGKTTLLAEWLAAGPAAGGGRLVAWLSLDRGDNDPASFWAYVVAALRTVAAGVGEGALALLRAPRRPAIETVLTVLLNDLGAVPADVVLVLDDYHVIEAPEVQDGMVFWLEHLPPGVHVVIASRADPVLPLARLRARGELAEIRAAELRFTAAEGEGSYVMAQRVACGPSGLGAPIPDLVGCKVQVPGRRGQRLPGGTALRSDHGDTDPPVARA